MKKSQEPHIVLAFNCLLQDIPSEKSKILDIYSVVTLYRVSYKKGIDKFIRSCSRPQFTVFEFIWIQYICKFCLVYHLKKFDASR